MSHWEKHRQIIWNATQHIYRHTLDEFSYNNEAIPEATTVEGALDYILAVIYPNAKAAVNTVGDLPAVGNTINDYRVVLDDGDGKQAAYRWEQREGDAAAKWYKVADMDWSSDSILAQLLDVTLPLYVSKGGVTDIDENGDPIVGVYAGQRFYGGDLPNQNLTLNATSGDGTGPRTGFVQIDDQFRPTIDDSFDLSTVTERWRNLYLSTSAVVGTTTYGAALITDSSGQISFDDENIITTGNITGANITGTQLIADDSVNTMVLTPGSIADSTGQISLGAADLLTTGTLRGGAAILTEGVDTLSFNAFESGPNRATITSSTGLISFDDEDLVTTGNISSLGLSAGQLDIDDLRLDGNMISNTALNGSIVLNPNGIGVVSLLGPLNALAATFTGDVDVVGRIDIDNIRVDGNTLSSTDANGNVSISPDGSGVVEVLKSIVPGAGSLDLGSASNVFRNLYISGGLSDGTDTIAVGTIIGLNSLFYRDVAQTIPAQTGDSLFYDAINGVYLASEPDSEITHNTISGLTTGDAGHTQFAMLAGRVGGQTISGGTSPLESLTLQSTTDVTKGVIQFSDNFVPTTSASFSGTWQGLDIGSPTNILRDIYSRGEFRGLRLENILSTALPSFSGQTPGRLYFATDNNKAYVDTGSKLSVLGVAKYSQDQSFNGSITQLDVDVSSEISDARQAQWQLLDNANNFEIMYVTIRTISASTVRIITNAPLPAGSYRLIGIE